MSLDPFYIDLINKLKMGSGPGIWAQSYYGIFEKAINDNNFKVVAEVGIGYGFHARSILDNTNVDKLFLIDPMTYYPNDMFVDDVLSYGGFDLLYKNIKIHLKQYENRYTWFPQPSITIKNDQIPDESLDAVFIDGDHSYEAVSKDLPFWYKKIKKGGWLLGDDYKSCCPGTTRAVDEFAQINNFKIEFLYKPNNDYPIYKFVKQ